MIATVRRLPRRFWAWYERNYAVNVGVAAILFALQILHLIWLTGDVVVLRLTGESFLPLGGLVRAAVLVVDYTEIPALIGTSLIYLNDLRKGWNPRSALFLLFLNSQWLHIFWITDEFVVGEFGGAGSSLPVWLAWVAIGIDYLELPVIFDTFRRFGAALRRGTVSAILREGLTGEPQSGRGSPSSRSVVEGDYDSASGGGGEFGVERAWAGSSTTCGLPIGTTCSTTAKKPSR